MPNIENQAAPFSPSRSSGISLRQLALSGLITLAALLSAPPSLAGGKTAPSYSYFVTGTRYFNPGNLTPLQPLPAPAPKLINPLVLMGGGPDVDSAFRWMIQSAGIGPSTGGRFVVIRSVGTDAYDPYLMYSDATGSTTGAAVDGYVGGAALGLSAAETLVIPDAAAANDDFVNKVLATANSVWIAGGDQSSYLGKWKGSKLQTTLKALIARGVPIGGTSAGANVLGQFIYSGQNGSVTSDKALSNPYNREMTFDPQPFTASSFLAPTAAQAIPALGNTFVDPHFDARDRMGRLVAFVSRSIAANGSQGCSGGVLNYSQGRGIGVGVETALLIQGDGSASHPWTGQRVSNPSTTTLSAVYFLSPLTTPTQCLSGKTLTIQNLRVQRLSDSNSQFNLGTWQPLSGVLSNYDVSVNAGIITSSAAGGSLY